MLLNVTYIVIDKLYIRSAKILTYEIIYSRTSFFVGIY